MNAQAPTPAGHGPILPIPEYGGKQQFFRCVSKPSPSIGRNPVFPPGWPANSRYNMGIQS